jgi:tetratricopeptide (TPR) repeat protein
LSEAAFGKAPSEAYLRTELADRLEAAAQWDEAIALRREVVAIHDEGGDTEELLKARQALARSLLVAGRVAEAVVAYREHLALIERARPPGDADRVRAVNDLAVALIQIEENGEAATLLEGALRTSDGLSLDPDLVAALNTNLAAAWSRTGRLVEAESAARRAIKLWQSIGKEADLSRARALNLLVEIDVELGRHDDALAASDLALDLTRGRETDPTAVEALDARGMLLFSLQKFRPAEEIQRGALTSWLDLRPEDSTKVIVARQNLAGTLVELGSLDEARELLALASASAERALVPDSAVLASVLSSRGTLLSRLGELSESAEAFAEALSIWRTRAPGSAMEARELSNLAAARLGLGRIGEAEDQLRRSIGIWLDVAPDHPDLAFAYGNLIEVLYRQGRLAEALGLARRVVATAEADGGLAAANARYVLALLLRADGKPAEAEAEVRRVLDIRRAELGEKHPEVAAALGELCLVLWDGGNIRDALSCAGESLALHRAIFPTRHREIGVAVNNLAFVEASAGRLAEAERDYREALDIAGDSYGPIHPATTVMTANLAIHLLDRVGRPSEALGLLRQASANASAAALSEASETIGTDKLLQRARGIFAVEVRAAWAVAAGVADR